VIPGPGKNAGPTPAVAVLASRTRAPETPTPRRGPTPITGARTSARITGAARLAGAAGAINTCVLPGIETSRVGDGITSYTCTLRIGAGATPAARSAIILRCRRPTSVAVYTVVTSGGRTPTSATRLISGKVSTSP